MMENMTKGQKVLAGFEAARQGRWNWEAYWQAISDFFDINRATFIQTRASGERRTTHLFDSTGLKASGELAAIIHSIVTNPASQWFNGQYGSGFEADDEAKEWLEDCISRMFTALNTSNFNVEATLGYRDFGNFGTAIPHMMPVNPTKFEGVRFRSVFLDEIFIEVDSTNRLTAYYWEHNFTLAQAKSRWPEATDKLTEDLENRVGKIDALNENTKIKRVKFIECVKKREDGSYSKAKNDIAANRPYERTIIAKDDPDTIIVEDGRYSLYTYPYTWNRAPGELYGRGPGSEALPDMRTLNEVVRMDLEATAMQIKPPMKTRHNNVIGDIRIVPGGVTVCRDPAGLMPFGNDGNVNVSKLRIEDLRNSVKSIFLLDKLALPPRDQVGEMTAYEIQRRTQEMNQVLGPILARINDEWLQPMLEDLFYLMLRTEGFAEMPESVKGAEIKFHFVNPLSLAQKAEEMAAVQLWMQDLIMLAQAGKPEALDLIDDDNLARGSSEARGVPQRYVTDVKKVKEMRQQRAQQQQEQHQADVQAKQADAQYKMQQGVNDDGRPQEGT